MRTCALPPEPYPPHPARPSGPPDAPSPARARSALSGPSGLPGRPGRSARATPRAPDDRPAPARPAPAEADERPWALPRAWLALLLVLGACGGGGGGTASSPADTGTVAATPATPAGNTAVSSAAVRGGLRIQAGTLALLVAAGDAHSEAVARRYQLARGVPDSQLIRVAVDTGSPVIAEADFQRLKAQVDAALPAQVQATLVTWRQPSRVQGSRCSMGLTSALALGYDARWCGGCDRTQASPYYDSPATSPWQELGLRPSMMLGADTVAAAQALIDRGLAAEGLLANAAPATPAQGWLVRTADAARSVRHPDFSQLAATPVPGVQWHALDASADAAAASVQDQADLMFYFTGLARVPALATLRWLPGAVADHLTSYAGLLPEANGQMPATDWLAAGATGSYGTVEEPCNYTEKFPRASVLVRHYSAGQTLIEAYWKSVQWPGQGLFVGDPLARPWARL